MSLSDDATRNDLQAAIAALLASAGNESSSLDRYRERLQRYSSSPSQVAALDEQAIAVVNRLMYQPAIAFEQSSPVLDSLIELHEKSKGKGVPVVLFAVTLQATGNLILAILSALGVILVQCVASFASGGQPGLEEFGRRLTQRFILRDHAFDLRAPIGGPSDARQEIARPPRGLPAADDE